MTLGDENRAFGDFRAAFGGDLILRDDPAYEQARAIHNAMISKRPAAIAQCRSEADVVDALAFARSEGLEVAIRGGGHSVAGASLTEGGVVIDLRQMNHVEVDPDAGLARVQGGACWGNFDRATQPHGLMATGGRVSTTGVAGLTLGGGSGWVERKFGLACDNLESVTMITADGRRVRADEDENPELFWALHGGGGNFGIATELVFRLHHAPTVTFGLLIWPAEAGPEVVRTYRDLIDAGAPEELGGGLSYFSGPAENVGDQLDFSDLPELRTGERSVGVVVVYIGDERQAREAVAPMFALSPQMQMFREMDYADVQCGLDYPNGNRNYWSAEHLVAFDDAAVATYCEQGEQMLVPTLSELIGIPWGGAVSADLDRWPMPHRDAGWVVHTFGTWSDPKDDERGVAWARGAAEAMRPFSTGAVYLNFIGDEGSDRIIAGYGKENYERLATVKAEFDPDNVFHLSHNIKPSPLVDHLPG